MVGGSCSWLATGVTGPCIVLFPLKSTSSSQYVTVGSLAAASRSHRAYASWPASPTPCPAWSPDPAMSVAFTLVRTPLISR